MNNKHIKFEDYFWTGYTKIKSALGHIYQFKNLSKKDKKEIKDSINELYQILDEIDRSTRHVQNIFIAGEDLENGDLIKIEDNFAKKTTVKNITLGIDKLYGLAKQKVKKGEEVKVYEL